MISQLLRLTQEPSPTPMALQAADGERRLGFYSARWALRGGVVRAVYVILLCTTSRRGPSGAHGALRGAGRACARRSRVAPAPRPGPDAASRVRPAARPARIALRSRPRG